MKGGEAKELSCTEKAEANTCTGKFFSEGRIDKFGRENTIITDEAKCIAVAICRAA